MSETTILDAFVLDDGHGCPAVLAAAITDAGPPMTLAIARPDRTVVEVPGTDALPASGLAALDEDAFDDGNPVWVASLDEDAPAGMWVQYWTHHCAGVDMILGRWRPQTSVPALHVRGHNPAGTPVVLSVPLLDRRRLARVETLIETNQQALLDEACDWEETD